MNNIENLWRHSMNIRVLRYLFAGGLLFLVDLCIVYLLVVSLEVRPEIAQLFGRTVGACLGFFLHRNFTFRASGNEYNSGALSQGSGYIMLAVATLLVSPIVLMLMLAIFNQQLVIAKIATEIVIVAGNYLVMRLVFRHKEQG